MFKNKNSKKENISKLFSQKIEDKKKILGKEFQNFNNSFFKEDTMGFFKRIIKKEMDFLPSYYTTAMFQVIVKEDKLKIFNHIHHLQWKLLTIIELNKNKIKKKNIEILELHNLEQLFHSNILFKNIFLLKFIKVMDVIFVNEFMVYYENINLVKKRYQEKLKKIEEKFKIKIKIEKKNLDKNTIFNLMNERINRFYEFYCSIFYLFYKFVFKTIFENKQTIFELPRIISNIVIKFLNKKRYYIIPMMLGKFSKLDNINYLINKVLYERTGKDIKSIIKTKIFLNKFLISKKLNPHNFFFKTLRNLYNCKSHSKNSINNTIVKDNVLIKIESYYSIEKEFKNLINQKDSSIIETNYNILVFYFSYLKILFQISECLSIQKLIEKIKLFECMINYFFDIVEPEIILDILDIFIKELVSPKTILKLWFLDVLNFKYLNFKNYKFFVLLINKIKLI